MKSHQIERTLTDYIKLALAHHAFGHAASLDSRPNPDNE